MSVFNSCIALLFNHHQKEATMNDMFTQTARSRGMEQAQTYDMGLRSFMLGIYNYMGSALVLTGIVALFASQSPAFLSMMYAMEGNAITGLKPMAWLIMLAPLGMAIWLSLGINRMSVIAAQTSFWVFAVLMGLSLSSIFLSFTGTSITRVFFITAGMFGAMSIYGYTTQRDLTNWGSFLMMGVIGLITASVVNLFLQSSALQFAVSVLGVFAFTALTAYDTQKLKFIYYKIVQMGESMKKATIIGALTLYMDFINIFVSLMQLLGERR
jgi:FtsH-binding integral membrane protein